MLANFFALNSLPVHRAQICSMPGLGTVADSTKRHQGGGGSDSPSGRQSGPVQVSGKFLTGWESCEFARGCRLITKYRPRNLEGLSSYEKC
jgi:hypothetical protein